MAHIEDYYILYWSTPVSNGSRRFNVSHPKTLEHIEMWEERYKKSGVSYTLKRITVTTETQEIEEYCHLKRM